jgi:alginate O-acetyltransferase complex protein AlgI
MIFASFEFLFLFLPIFLGAYFLTPRSYRNVTILAFSWAFYAWWRIDFLALLVAVTIFTFCIARAMGHVGPATPRGRTLMILGLIGNLGVLGYFKYANFGVATFNGLISAAGFGPVSWTEIVLPIGLSFYVLQSVSYLVDIRRGDVPISRSFLNYAAYKAIFSQLIAGPIVRYAEIADELKHREHSLRQFGIGSRIFMVGFAMKTAIADTLSPLTDAVFALAQPTLADAWMGALSYMLQLYFDFAGYSLMAIGLARMIGFHFPQNFDHPYLSTSIQDFWQRWHMTLSRFLRDYLYIPFGGNRLGPVRTYVNLMLVMAIGGLWHGSSWNFVLWGGWQGALLASHRWYSRRPGVRAAAARRTPSGAADRALSFAWRNAATMLGVLIGWVIFRAHDLAGAGAMYAGMLGFHGVGLSDELAWQATPDRVWMIPCAIVLVYLPLLQAALRRAAARFLPMAANERPAWGSLSLALSTMGPLAGFVLAVVLLYSRAAVPFLYFQF